MNTEHAQALLAAMTGSIEREAVGTRKVIAAINNPAYKPDAKSRSAMEIATHLAMSDVWFADSIAKGAFAWTGEPATPPELTDPAAVARWHEKHLGAGLAKLRAMQPGDLVREVDFFGMKAPAVTWLVMMNNHAIHHRGQLAAYLRPMGSKVPAIYGMSADEPMPTAV
jgi:uncharacterized damage-inducible protein DinB